MSTNYYVDPVEVQKLLLEFINSEKFQNMFNNTTGKDSSDFKAGAMWGMAIASMLISNEPTKFYLPNLYQLAEEIDDKMTCMCGCRNCIETIKGIIRDDNVPVRNQCDKCYNRETCNTLKMEKRSSYCDNE